MGFNNLLIRFFTSLPLIFLLLILVYYFEEYIPFAFILIYSMIFYEILFFFKNKKRRSFLLILYVFISLISIEIYIIYFYEKLIFLYFILLITCFDIFSYIFGSLFGKKRILPKISPNKTIFGVIAGLFLTLIISLLFNNLFYIFTFRTSFFFSILIILSAFIGDVIESFYKRHFEIKNSGNFLPGHGGIFDRMDSFVMGSIAMLIFNYFI
jgi:phosphatidate cytidylyltransferase|tara:strand:+ start:41 stop:673 length:633 start_codon:yes stop_codon:yes gene_type:complete